MNKEKTKYRFNAVDIAIILVLLAVIAFCAAKMKSITGNDALHSSNTYIVTVEMKKMREDFADNFKPDDIIYSRITNDRYGKVLSVKKTPSTDLTVSSIDGTVATVDVPDRYDITFELEIKSDDTIAVGQFITFKNNTAVASGYALTVTHIKEIVD